MASATSDDAGAELTTTTTTTLAPEPPFVPVDPRQAGLTFEPYTSEARLQAMADLIAKDLSDPYSVYTYRYFVNEWPQLSETVRTRTHTAALQRADGPDWFRQSHVAVV